MDRLKKRCFAGSLIVHGGLLLLVIFGSAFFVSNEPTEAKENFMTLVRLTDLPSSSPNKASEAAPPPQVHRETQPPPAAEPRVHAAKPPPKPGKPDPEENEEPLPATNNGTRSKPHETKKSSHAHAADPARTNAATFNLKNLVHRKVTKPADTSDESTARDEERRAIAGAFRDAKRNIEQNSSGSTDIAMPNLGAAFGNYREAIYNVYKTRYDQEVLQAGEFATEAVSVKVAITISRSGKVTESKIITLSSNPKMDRLIRRVLSQIEFIAPFPSEAKDSERTFEIQFNLKPNGQLG